MKLVICTSNHHKLAEYQELLQGQSLEIVSLRDLGIRAEPIENGLTLRENAYLKANFYQQYFKDDCLLISDDSGLFIQSLPNLLGVNSHKDAELFGGHKRINEYLLKHLTNQRQAFFACVICLIIKDKVYYFEGKVQGKIAKTLLDGPNGFGYDPIFIPNGYQTSFARLDPIIKNTISHRARALTQLLDFLGSQDLD